MRRAGRFPAMRLALALSLALAAAATASAQVSAGQAGAGQAGAGLSGARLGRLSRVAVLDLDARNGEAGTEALAVKRCLDILGIACLVTADPAEATREAMVCAAGGLWNGTLTSREFYGLAAWVESGGILLSSGGLGSKYFPLFGIGQPVDSRKRFRVRFEAPGTDPSLAYLDRPEERETRLGDEELFKEVVWTRSFPVKGARSLARTEDGLSLFSAADYGKGRAYALGLSFTDAVLLPQVGGDYEAQRSWINGFEPGADVFILLLKAIFEDSFEPFVYLCAIPEGRKTALLLSHDVDAQSSFAHSVDFAAMERRRGARSTFFVTTKYFADETDAAYWDPARAALIRKAKELGGDVGSHSVAHSRRFGDFPSGDAAVRKADYDPVRSPTVLGELLVSKELLDGGLPGQRTRAFRAGELRIPRGLGSALELAGYRYDSSYSANDTMTNFAYRMMRDRSPGSGESGIVEIPVTFDDSQGLLTASNWRSVVAAWLDVVWANAANEAISVLLIHPTVAGYKLEAEELLLESLEGKGIWIGDVSSYGAFWNERAALGYEARLEGDRLVVRLGGESLPPGQCLVAGRTPLVKSVEVRGSGGAVLDCETTERDGKLFIRARGAK